MLSKGLQNYTNSQHKFLHMGSTPPPPFTQCVKIHPIWQRMASLRKVNNAWLCSKILWGICFTIEICYWKEVEFVCLTINCSPEIGMHVEIRDPDDKIILSKVPIRSHIFCNLIVVQKSKRTFCSGLQQWRQIHFHLSHSRRACHLFVQVMTPVMISGTKVKSIILYSRNSLDQAFSAILPSGSLALSWGSILISR